MSGAGTSGCGVGPCGLDPVSLPSDKTNIDRVAAIKFDPSTRRFVMRSDGQLETIHPVDQMMAIALGLPAGTLSSTPTIGHTLLDQKTSGDPSFEADAADRIRRAVAHITRRGLVRIVSITTHVVDDPRGRNEHVVEYENLKLRKRRTIAVAGS